MKHIVQYLEGMSPEEGFARFTRDCSKVTAQGPVSTHTAYFGPGPQILMAQGQIRLLLLILLLLLLRILWGLILLGIQFRLRGLLLLLSAGLHPGYCCC